MKENVSPVSITRDLKAPFVLTTVCGMSSRFFEVTVVPAGTEMDCGPKLKLSIFTLLAHAASCVVA